MIFAMGDISGGLFNPALTLAFTARFYGTGQGLEGNFYSQKLADVCMQDSDGRSARKEPIKYVFAQLLGGAAGSGTTMLIYLFKMSTVWPAAEVKTGNTTKWTDVHTGEVHPSIQYTLGQAFFAEAFGTFILCFVVLCVASRKDALKDYTAFCIGGCIVGAGYSFGPLSGAILNPAVALANSLCFKLSLIYTAEPFCYMLAEFCGGALAAVVFKYLIYNHEFQTGGGLEEGLNPRENE
jgi:glycerol uptake facilitator-like aquaporin